MNIKTLAIGIVIALVLAVLALVCSWGAYLT